jgi:hypothetical protein
MGKGKEDRKVGSIRGWKHSSEVWVNSSSDFSPLIVLVILIAGVVWFSYYRRQKRIKYLMDKYGDEAIVQRILGGNFWQGQTAQQLLDSIGSPLSIDRKSMATRKREVWKYNRKGKNRYGLRITLDNDVVSGWDYKN